MESNDLSNTKKNIPEFPYEIVNPIIPYDFLHSSPIKGKELLAKSISDRISFLKKSIDEIYELLQERYRLKECLNADIDERTCQILTKLYRLGHYDENPWANTSNARRISLEQQITELYKERRQQELGHWQDSVMLKKELRNMEKELLSALRDLWMVRFISWGK